MVSRVSGVAAARSCCAVHVAVDDLPVPRRQHDDAGDLLLIHHAPHLDVETLQPFGREADGLRGGLGKGRVLRLERRKKEQNAKNRGRKSLHVVLRLKQDLRLAQPWRL